MARILVAGCGYVGSALAGRLADAGHDVVGVRRTPDPVAGFSSAALDLGAVDEVTSWLRDAADFDAVVYSVAATSGEESAYRVAYVDALRALQKGLRKSQGAAPLLLFTSSTSVYAQDAGEWVDETSVTTPAGYRGAVQLEAEALVEAWEGPRCSLRLGGLYGPGRTRLAASVRDQQASATPVYSNRIHRDDAAGALAHLVEQHLSGKSLAPTLVGVDNEPSLRSEVVAWIAAYLGVRAPPPETGPLRGKRCRNTGLGATGYVFRYPTYRDGYAALLADRAFSGR